MSTRESAMQWWNREDILSKTLLTDKHHNGRTPESLTGREIEAIWNKAKVCDTFKINSKVSFEKEGNGAYHLTVINSRGFFNKGLLYIPCANENGIIDDYPVIYLYPSNIEKAKKWWDKQNIINQKNLADIETLGDHRLLRHCDIEMLWNKYNNSGDVTRGTFTYEDMVAIYNLGRSDAKDSQVQGKYVDNHKDWLTENYG